MKRGTMKARNPNKCRRTQQSVFIFILGTSEALSRKLAGLPSSPISFYKKVLGSHYFGVSLSINGRLTFLFCSTHAPSILINEIN